jgi:hypothetical protein
MMDGTDDVGDAREQYFIKGLSVRLDEKEYVVGTK